MQRNAHVLKKANVSIKQKVNIIFQFYSAGFLCDFRSPRYCWDWLNRAFQVPNILWVKCILLDYPSFWFLNLKPTSTTHPNQDRLAQMTLAFQCQNEMTGWPTVKMAFACRLTWLGSNIIGDLDPFLRYSTEWLVWFECQNWKCFWKFIIGNDFWLWCPTIGDLVALLRSTIFLARIVVQGTIMTWN